MFFDLIGNPPGTSSVVQVDNIEISPASVFEDTFSVIDLPGPFSGTTGIGHWTLTATTHRKSCSKTPPSNGFLVFKNSGANFDRTVLGTTNGDSPDGEYFAESGAEGEAYNLQIQIGEVVSKSIDDVDEVDTFTFSNTLAGQTAYFDIQSGTQNQFKWKLTAPTGGEVFSVNFSDRGPLTLDEVGSYTLTVEGKNGHTGAYQFQTHSVPATSLTSINIGDVANGSIDVPGEGDAFEFSGTAGQRLFFDGQISLVLLGKKLLAPSGQVVFESGSFGDVDPFTLPETGNYRFEVDPFGDRTGAYQFQFVVVPATVATSIDVGQIVESRIDVQGEVDLFQFQAEAGQSLFFDVQQVPIQFKRLGYNSLRWIALLELTLRR